MKVLFPDNTIERKLGQQVKGLIYNNQRPYKIIISIDEFDEYINNQADWNNIKEYIKRDLVYCMNKGVIELIV